MVPRGEAAADLSRLVRDRCPPDAVMTLLRGAPGIQDKLMGLGSAYETAFGLGTNLHGSRNTPARLGFSLIRISWGIRVQTRCIKERERMWMHGRRHEPEECQRLGQIRLG